MEYGTGGSFGGGGGGKTIEKVVNTMFITLAVPFLISCACIIGHTVHSGIKAGKSVNQIVHE